MAARLTSSCYSLIYNLRKKNYTIETRRRVVVIPYGDFEVGVRLRDRQLQRLQKEFGFGVQSIIE